MAASHGLVRMFGEEGLRKMSGDPVMIPYLNDPLFIEMIDDISLHPENIVKYQSEPKLQMALMVILPMMMSTIPPPRTGPSGPPPPTVDSAEEAKEKGNDCFRNGDFNGAVRYYDQAILLDPKNMTYLSNKASALNKLSRFDDAMEAALLAVEVGQSNNASDEQMAKAYVKLANAASGSGRDKGAFTALQESLNYYKDPAVIEMVESLRRKLNIEVVQGI